MIEFATAAVLLAVTEVGKGVASEMGKSVWEGISAAYKKWRGVSPNPDDIDAEAARSLAATGYGVAALAQQYRAASPALRRAELAAEALKGARILWVDDHPEWNRLERHTLGELGCIITSVETTRSALACLRTERFDAVISDIARGGSATEGVNVLPEIREVGHAVPVIFYVGRVDGPVPRGAFGITDEPSEVLHLCMDAFERTRL